MLEQLKERVYQANIALQHHGLVCLTWGNASAYDSASGLVVIKPSGVAYDTMSADDMVVINLRGEVVEGRLKPSSDAPTHVELYRSFPQLGGVVHTHSRWATVFSQSLLPIRAFGTTHADTFYGEVPCTRCLTEGEISGNYEVNTGRVIVETVAERNPLDVPAILVASHAPFTWGATVEKAVENAVILEEVAAMAWHTELLNGDARLQAALADKHYYRKHGENAYYGQEETK